MKFAIHTVTCIEASLDSVDSRLFEINDSRGQNEVTIRGREIEIQKQEMNLIIFKNSNVPEIVYCITYIKES